MANEHNLEFKIKLASSGDSYIITVSKDRKRIQHTLDAIELDIMTNGDSSLMDQIFEEHITEMLSRLIKSEDRHWISHF